MPVKERPMVVICNINRTQSHGLTHILNVYGFTFFFWHWALGLIKAIHMLSFVFCCAILNPCYKDSVKKNPLKEGLGDHQKPSHQH